MSQLSFKLDNLLQEARRAVQRSPRASQRNPLDGQPPVEEFSSAVLFGVFGKQLITAELGNAAQGALSVGEPGTIGTCSSDNTLQQQHCSGDLAQQLEAAKEQCSLKQQEVEVLQAQVQRLCAFVESSVANEATADASGHEAALKQQLSDVRSQLSQATAELHECKTQLLAALDASQQLQSLLATTSAAKAGLERRVGALKLLLAEQVGENVGLVQGLQLCQEGLEAARLQLERAEAQQAAARDEIASREEDCAAMRSALHLVNEQLATLADQQQQQQPQQQQPDQHACSSSTSEQHTNEQQQQQQQQLQLQQQQEELIVQQQQELARQQQELAATAQQLQDVCSLLALKNDSLAHLTRHSTMLDTQLATARHQLQEVNSRQGSSPPVALSGTEDAAPQCSMGQARPASPACLNSTSEGMLAGSSFNTDQHRDTTSTPSASSCAPAAAPTAVQGEAAAAVAGSSPRLGEQLSALSPFAKARGFMAHREAEATARLKEELRDKERALRELTAETDSTSSQLHGLQTVLTAKTAQCNRLETEARQLERQLKQAHAAAAAEQEGLRGEMSGLGQRVAEVEGQLLVSQQREQEQQLQLVAVRAKLAQVLEALVQDAASVQKHQPQLHALYLQDAPAALADACSSIMMIPGASAVTTLATLAAAQQAVAGSTAAAVAVLNTAGSSSSAGRSADPNTPSNGGGGGLFGGGGGKLLDALLGRKNSTGLGEIDRVVSISSSRRTSQECSRAATPQHVSPPAGVGLHALSRAASHEAAMTPVP